MGRKKNTKYTTSVNDFVESTIEVKVTPEQMNLFSDSILEKKANLANSMRQKQFRKRKKTGDSQTTAPRKKRKLSNEENQQNVNKNLKQFLKEKKYIDGDFEKGCGILCDQNPQILCLFCEKLKWHPECLMKFNTNSDDIDLVNQTVIKCPKCLAKS